jgi:hypothetical protein
MAPSNFRVIFTATSDWWQIVSRDCEIETEGGDCFPQGWEDVFVAAGIDGDDPESWCALVTEVAPRHSAIKIGDLACCQGVGDDVYFVRRS